jgi:hypothetical protein
MRYVHQVEERGNEERATALLKSRKEAEAFASTLEQEVKKIYPNAKVSTFSHGYEVNLTEYISFNFPRLASVKLTCHNLECEVEGFVGWPPKTIRDDFDAYVIGQPECVAMHERLIENGSVLLCRAFGLEEASKRFLDIAKVILNRAEELKGGE